MGECKATSVPKKTTFLGRWVKMSSQFYVPAALTWGKTAVLIGKRLGTPHSLDSVTNTISLPLGLTETEQVFQDPTSPIYFLFI
jgi:hypothetical protein